MYIATGGLLPSVLRANQTPRLYVRLLNPSRSLKAALTLLPSTVVTCSLYTHVIGCFRQLVGAAFLRGRLGLALPSESCGQWSLNINFTIENSLSPLSLLSLSLSLPLSLSRSLPCTDYVNKAALNVFLKALDQPDVMDFTLVSTLSLWSSTFSIIPWPIGTIQWQNEASKACRQGIRILYWLWQSCTLEFLSSPLQQSLSFASGLLETVLLLHTYPLLHSPSFPEMIWANENNEKVSYLYI